MGAGGGGLLRANLVVPLRQGRAVEPPQLRHLLVVDLDALGVGPGYPRGGDLQARRGGRGADGVQDRLEAVQRPPGPVEADEVEQAVFGLVPLAAAAGIMSPGDAQPMRVAEGVLECMLPGPGTAPVAATAVGEDQEASGARVANTAFKVPPGFDAIDGELEWIRRRACGRDWRAGRRCRRGRCGPRPRRGSRGRAPRARFGSRPCRTGGTARPVPSSWCRR